MSNLTLETSEDWYANASLRRAGRGRYAGFEAEVDTKLSGRGMNATQPVQVTDVNTMTTGTVVGPRARERSA